jgi:hypothetical protein
MDLIVEVNGELMNLMFEMNPSLKSEEQQQVLYLKCKKALYGHIEAARVIL